MFREASCKVGYFASLPTDQKAATYGAEAGQTLRSFMQQALGPDQIKSAQAMLATLAGDQGASGGADGGAGDAPKKKKAKKKKVKVRVSL
jgi:hypothetical protein